MKNHLAYLPAPNLLILPIPLIEVETGLWGTSKGKICPQSDEIHRALGTSQKYWDKKFFLVVVVLVVVRGVK